MEGKLATNRTTSYDGGSSIRREILRLALSAEAEATAVANAFTGRKCAYWGWAKIMEWKYPGLEVSITNPKLFKAAGALEAAAAL